MTPFTVKTIRELPVETRDVGSGIYVQLQSLCTCDVRDGGIRLWPYNRSSISRIKEAVGNKWPWVSFTEMGNSLFLRSDSYLRSDTGEAVDKRARLAQMSAEMAERENVALNRHLQIARDAASKANRLLPSDSLGAATSISSGSFVPKDGCCNMKVAIVGVEGSGKTVMLAGLGALFSQPNADGVFISPKNFKTLTYVDRLMSMLKSGQWPAATAEDVMQGLDWVVRQRADNARPVQLGEISLLDFAGEVYRAAFVQDEGENKAVENEIARLKKYLAEADCILVLVNLSDVIANGPFNARVEESVWITNAILDYVLPETRSDGKKLPRAAIVLSQADSYASTIEECGGPKQTLQRYLPHVANNYGWLDTFAVCTVDKTVLDEEGRPVPAPDFSPKGLAPIMEWVLKK